MQYHVSVVLGVELRPVVRLEVRLELSAARQL